MSGTVAVLGGGPAGIYAALRLSRRRIPVILFEREGHLGGLAASTVVDDQRVDHGSHRLHPSIDPDILSDLQGLLGGELQLRQRRGRIRLGDRWLSFPLSPLELISRLPLRVTARLGAGAIQAMMTPRSDDTFADVVATGLGRPMGEMFYYPYARKIWGLDPTLLSGEQARRRVAADTPMKLARKALLAGPERGFFYPTGGFGRIPEVLAEAAARTGAEIRLNAPVERLDRLDDGWNVVAGGEGHRVQLVLSTLPLTVLVRLLQPPPWVAAAAGQLSSRSMILVYLSVPGPRWTSYDAHYFPGADVAFTRISESKNYRDDGSDPPERSVICVEIPSGPGEAAWEAPDEALAKSVRETTLRLGLPDPGTEAKVKRLAHAYPVYRVGSEDSLGVVGEWLEDVDGVVTFGRQGLFAHDNTHHALAMARDAVDCISPGLGFDRDRWRAARERFEHHVVED